MRQRGGFRSVVVGIDGSRHARDAVAFLTRLRPPAGGRATVVAAVEPLRTPAMPLGPKSIRSGVAAEVAALNANQRRVAQRLVDEAVGRLKKAGWRARGEVRSGVPAPELLRAVGAARADLLVVGARGTSGVKRILLGSVADGVLKHAPVSVLIVK